MTNKCSQCGRFVCSTEGVKCTKCGTIFHRDCVKLSPSGPVPNKWSCHGCHKGKNKQNKTVISKGLNTPVPKPSVVHSSPLPLSASILAPVSALPSAADVGMQDATTNSIVAELRLLRSEMATFRGEIAQLNNTLSEFNSRVDSVEFRLSRLEEQAAPRESDENEHNVQAKISELQSQLNNRDQDLLINDVQISGLQEATGENLISISCQLAKKLGLELDNRDFVFAERSGPKHAALATADGGVRAPRPRPVVVRLARRAVRDDLLRAARVRRGADSSGIVDAEPRRFYVNERLTRVNRQLFNKAREEGRNRNWRYVWTKGGRIFIRQTDTSPVHRVSSEVDFNRLFGSGSF